MARGSSTPTAPAAMVAGGGSPPRPRGEAAEVADRGKIGTSAEEGFCRGKAVKDVGILNKDGGGNTPGGDTLYTDGGYTFAGTGFCCFGHEGGVNTFGRDPGHFPYTGGTAHGKEDTSSGKHFGRDPGFGTFNYTFRGTGSRSFGHESGGYTVGAGSGYFLYTGGATNYTEDTSSGNHYGKDPGFGTFNHTLPGRDPGFGTLNYTFYGTGSRSLGHESGGYTVGAGSGYFLYTGGATNYNEDTSSGNHFGKVPGFGTFNHTFPGTGSRTCGPESGGNNFGKDPGYALGYFPHTGGTFHFLFGGYVPYVGVTFNYGPCGRLLPDRRLHGRIRPGPP